MPFRPLFKLDASQSLLMQWAGAGLLLLASTIYVFAPLLHAFRGANDFAWVYMAGRSWLKGVSPYDAAKWSQEWSAIVPSPWDGAPPPSGPYVYPPHWAPIAMPLALLPWRYVVRIWDLINVVAYLGVCGLTRKLAMRWNPALSRPLLWTFIALAGFNGAVRWCLVEAQLSLIPLFAVLGAFWALHENKQNWLAVFAFLAALKPQISLLPLLFILLNGGRTGMMRAGAAIVLVSLLAMAPTGLSNLPEHLRGTYALHASQPFNTPRQFFGLAALLGEFTTSHWPLYLSPLLGGLCVVVFAHWSRQAAPHDPLSDPLWQVGLLSALDVAFIPQHGYDLVLYIPVVIMSCLFKSRWLTFFLCLLVGLASRSKNIGLHWHIPVLPPVICLSIVVICLLGSVFKASTPGPLPS